MKNLIALAVLFAVTPVAFGGQMSKIENNFGKTDCTKAKKYLEAKKEKEELKSKAQSKVTS